MNDRALIKGIDYTGITICFFCHNGAGKYLFSKRSPACRDEHGTWEHGGGGLRFGEKREDALRREVKEEYCAEILAYEFLGVRESFREHEGKRTHWLALFYRAQVDPAQVAIGEPEKIEALQWCALDMLPEPLHSENLGNIAEFRSALL